MCKEDKLRSAKRSNYQATGPNTYHVTLSTEVNKRSPAAWNALVRWIFSSRSVSARTWAVEQADRYAIHALPSDVKVEILDALSASTTGPEGPGFCKIK